MVSEVQRERVLSETVLPGLCDIDDPVPDPVKPSAVDESFIRCHGWPFSAVVMWTFGEKIGNGWKKILWYSWKIAFIFSISIEMLQLLLRLGTFQLSDIFYNTVGGALGGVCYCVAMKARKRL